jgi:hypothetical protein
MNPKAFISYSWSSTEHQQWVLDLATQLRESGVDVTIDKWDLKEGHDALAFMEKMVTDPELRKVIVILDRKYAEKSDKREGGVGTESQIISPEIYAKTDQGKFVAVIAELDADGKPYLPAFYKSRIYIDLSQNDSYAQNFDQLLRWIYDKPAFPKPSLGKPPSFLDETTVLLPTRSRARRATDLLRSGSIGASGGLDEYLSTIVDSFEALRIERKKDAFFDDVVIENIGWFLPYRDEYIELVSTLARFAPSVDNLQLLHRFFEQLLPYMFRPKNINQWSSDDFDNFKFLIHELFLYTIAVLIRYERFDAATILLAEDYFVGDVSDFSDKPMQPFSIFRNHLQAFSHRNQRLGLRRLSLHADLIRDRSEASGVSLRHLMQADFVMFLRDSVLGFAENRRQRWWPETLVWYEEYSGPFEIFARGESARYFSRIKSMLAIESPDDLTQLLPHFGSGQARLYLPQWEFHSVSIENAANLKKLSSKP